MRSTLEEGGGFEMIPKMNDSELLYLKFKKRYSTQQLLTRFPRQKKRIMEVALLDVNNRTLREIIHEKKVFRRLRQLKRELHKALHSMDDFEYKPKTVGAHGQKNPGGG